jgi:5'-3' exonuclease
MGVSGLFGFLNENQKKLMGKPAHDPSNMIIQVDNHHLAFYIKKLTEHRRKEKIHQITVGIDTSIFLYKRLDNIEEMIKYMIQLTDKIIKLGMRPLFVFDGKFMKHRESDDHIEIFKQKESTVHKRSTTTKKHEIELNIYQFIQKIKKESTELIYYMKEIQKYFEKENQDIDIDLNEIIKILMMSDDELSSKINDLKKKSNHLSDIHIQSCKIVFEQLHIPFCVSYYEADSLLAQLSKDNVIQAVISEDSDLIAYGSEILIRGFDIFNSHSQLYVLHNILYHLRLNKSQMIDMCILFGTDYNKRLKKLNIYESYHFILENGNIETILYELFERNGKIPPSQLNYQMVRNIYQQSVHYSLTHIFHHTDFNDSIKDILRNMEMIRSF